MKRSEAGDIIFYFILFLVAAMVGMSAGCDIKEKQYDTPAEAKAHYEQVLAEEQERHRAAMDGEVNRS